MTHTPGPWIANGNSIEQDSEKAITIAHVYNCDEVPIPASETEANACLIAVAPEMREALMIANIHMHQWTGTSGPRAAEFCEIVGRIIARTRKQ